MNSKKPEPRATMHTVQVVRGVEGYSVYLNGYRLIGPKPWGGGTIVASGQVSWVDLEKADAHLGEP